MDVVDAEVVSVDVVVVLAAFSFMSVVVVIVVVKFDVNVVVALVVEFDESDDVVPNGLVDTKLVVLIVEILFPIVVRSDVILVVDMVFNGDLEAVVAAVVVVIDIESEDKIVEISAEGRVVVEMLAVVDFVDVVVKVALVVDVTITDASVDNGSFVSDCVIDGEVVYSTVADAVVLLVDDSGFSSLVVDVKTVVDDLVVSSKSGVGDVVSEISDESSVMLGVDVNNAGATVVSIVSFMP